MKEHPKRESRSLLPAVAPFALLLLGLAVPGCGGQEAAPSGDAKKKAPAVAVEAARKEPIARLIELTGETAAVESAVIASTVEGRIGYLPWREGDRVEPEQGRPVKLVEIDRDLYKAEVRAAEAALDVARARLDDMKAGTRPEEIAKAAETVRQIEESAAFAKIDLDRVGKLAESGSIPGEALEKARVAHFAETARLAAARRHLEMLEAGFTKTAVAVQEAMVKESSARLELARAKLDECVIHAPFKGTVMRVFARAGDMASTRAPLLEIADLSTLVVRTSAPEAYSSKIKEGMKAYVTLDAVRGSQLQLEVSRVFPGLDREMRTRTVEIRLSGAEGAAPGMFARIRIEIERDESAVTIPAQSVVTNPMGARVAFVVADGRAAQRILQTGIEQGGRAQVISGIAPGENVVTAGNEKLKDGVEVRIIEPGKPAGKSGPGTGAPQEKKGRAE